MAENIETKPDNNAEPSTSVEQKPIESSSNTYSGMATSAASNAAETATTAATGVKDSVFSMFGGGAKKEKKEDPEGETEDRSGSAKAKKDADAAEAPGEEGVSPPLALYLPPSSCAKGVPRADL